MKKILNFLFKSKREISIFALACLVQVVVFILTATTASGGFLWTSDAELYFDLARNLLEHKGFYMHPDLAPQTLRTPLYPMFVAGLYAVTKSVAVIVFIQNIIAAYVLVLVYRIGTALFNTTAAWWGTILFLFESRRLTNASQLMSETLFMFFFMTALLAFFRYMKDDKPDIRYVAVMGIASGLAVLTRPFILPLIPLCALLFVIVRWRKHRTMGIKNAALLITLTVIIVAPWSVRNYKVHDTFSLASTGGANAYITAVPRFLEYKTPGKEPYEELVSKAVTDLSYTGLTDLTPEQSFVRFGIFDIENQSYLLKESKEIISQDYPLFARIVVQKMGVFFIESSASRSYSILLHDISLPSQIFFPFLYFGGRLWWALMAVAMAWGWCVYAKNHRTLAHRLILLAIIGMMTYFALISSMNKDTPRLRLPVTPLITLCAVYGIMDIKKRIIHD